MSLVTRRDCWTGLLVYAGGDTIAACLLGRFTIVRMLGMMLVGGLLYAFEVPRWFRWVDRRTITLPSGMRRVLTRTGWALAYFNPLWVTRHVILIAGLEGRWLALDVAGVLRAALLSFAINLPLALVANAVIQNRVPLRWRFLASALFSAAMAVYYALSTVWLGAR